MFEKLWKFLVGLLVIGLVAGLVMWFMNREDRREMTPLMHELATEASAEFATRLPRVQTINTTLVLVTGRGNRDEELQFREMVLDGVVRSDKYRVRTWDSVQKVLEGGDWYTSFLQKSGLVPGVAPTTIEQASKALEWLDRANVVIDGVLLIEVTHFTEGPHQTGLGATIGLDAQIWSRTKKQIVETVPPVKKSIDSAWDLRYLSYAMSQQSLILRFLGFFVVACGLPWALIQVVRMVLRRRDNVANASLIVGLTLADLALAWVLLFAFGGGGLTIFGLIVFAGLMGYYNYDAVEYIGRRLL